MNGTSTVFSSGRNNQADLTNAVLKLRRGIIFSCLALCLMAISTFLLWPLMEQNLWIRGANRLIFVVLIGGTLYQLISSLRLVQSYTAAIGREILLRQLSIEEVKDYAIFMLDPTGNVMTWNAGAQRIKGYTADEIIGQHFSCFYPPEDLESGKPERELRIAADEGKVEDEGWRVRKDGSLLWANVVITAVRDENGKLAGFTKVTRDITDKKRANDKMIGLLESAPDAMVVVDKDGKIVLTNAQVEKLFGYEKSELLGSEGAMLIADHCRAEYATRRDAYLDDPTRHLETGVELSVRHKDGREIPVEISLSPLSTVEGVLVSSSFRDVTERKRREIEIQELNKGLERRNSELGVVNQELEAFTYSVAHDLRAPLRHVHGFAKILSDEYGPKLEPEAADFVKDIMQAADRMGCLIDDLLNLSRIARREVRFQVTGLRAVVDEAIAEQGSETQGREVDWRIDDLPFVECDPGLIKQVYANLIANALKYSRPRKITEITIGAEKNEEGQVFFVRDNGVGFNMKYADKLFGVFQRLHRREDFEGTGVGLATVSRIIQKHNGRIWADAEIDKGATFYFTIGTREGALVEEAA
ncbi:MAG TPA: PAS domain S-box protein [Capsulimonadaceae bacterium]|nr:PAS domain S-box protein [Capsulimonadaceae bacterium]